MSDKDVIKSVIVNYDILSKNIYNENLKICIRNLVCYKEKVYNNVEMMCFNEIFMVGILLGKELNRFMGNVVKKEIEKTK